MSSVIRTPQNREVRMFTKVIWATDGSEHADRAMAHAVDVARRDGAELHVVHVVEKLISGRASGLDALGNEGEIRAKVEQQANTVAAENGVKTKAARSPEPAVTTG
jgi:nucleotide-binding universal stress UspA family protein